MKKIIAILLSLSMITVFMPTFAFAAASEINVADITIESTNNLTYTGSKITPTVVVKVSGKTLTQGKEGTTGADCIVTYGENINAGTGTVIVNGNGTTYSGTNVTKTFNIGEKDIASLVNTANIPPQIVGHDLVIGDINVTHNGARLGANDIEFAPTKTVQGDNTVTLTGKGNYIGSLKINYFGGINLETKYQVVFDSGKQNSYEYTGKPITCSYTVQDKTTKVALSTSSYTGEIKNNIDVGNASLTITGKNDCIGEIVVGNIFKITERSLNNCKIDPIEDQYINEKPTIIVRERNTNQIVPQTNYSVDDNTPGSIFVWGKNNYKDTMSATYKVRNKKLTGTMVLSQKAFDYNGYDQKPTVVLKDNNGVQIPQSAYRLDWPNDVKNSGVKTIKAVGIGEYAGSLTENYIIKGRSIYDCTTTLSDTSFEYTGGAIIPKVTVQDTYKTLTNNVDYTLSFVSNVAKGTATVTITGIGNYAGSKSMNYYIGGTSIRRCSISLSQYNYQYTGYEAKPIVTVKYGSTPVYSYDYDVTYKNNINSGTATVVITGKNGYSGTTEINFYITGKDMSACTATLSQDTYFADGYAKVPSVTVKNGYTTLTPNYDYTLTYQDNQIAGTATILIKGKGGYSGSLVKTFKIIGTPQTMTTEFTRYTKYLSSDDFTIKPYATGDGTGFSFTSSDTSVVKVSLFGTATVVGTGVATITVKTIGVKKSEPVEKVITVTVKPSRAVYTVTSPSYSKMKVRITKAPGVTKYQIRYGRNGNYKNSYYTYSNSYYDTQSRTFTGLRSGSKYYVKVRAYKTMADGQKAWGNWGTIKAVRIK